MPPLWKELSEFILKSSDQNWLIFKIANWIEKESIKNKITEYFAMINYTPEFAFSESDLWFLISNSLNTLLGLISFSKALWISFSKILGMETLFISSATKEGNFQSQLKDFIKVIIRKYCLSSIIYEGGWIILQKK